MLLQVNSATNEIIMKKAKKTIENHEENNRFFFTAKPELAEWIRKQAEELGLETPEFIRAKMHLMMRQESK